MFGKDAGLALLKSTLVSFGLLVAITGCDGQPLGFAEEPPQAASPSPREGTEEETATEAARRDNLATRVLTCKVVDKADSATQTDWFARYAVDSMTRMLDKYPSLAAHSGLSSVSSCEEAIAYARAYDEYAALHPDFELAPDPLVASGAANVGTRKILPRLKIRGGNPDTYDNYYDFALGRPSPVVRIEWVYWLANGSTDKFTNVNGRNLNEFCQGSTYCSATFLNKYWLLTAAHCMQDARRQSVSKNPPRGAGQPFPYCLNEDGSQPLPPIPPKTMRGQSSWLILWSSTKPKSDRKATYYTKDSNPYNKDFPHLYLGSLITGVRAYQHPHPKYQFDQDPNTPADQYLTYDVALLGLDPSSNPEQFLPPDMTRQGGTVYVKAHSTSDPRNQTLFSMAGYGTATDAFGVPNGNSGRLNTALAPPNTTVSPG